MVLYKTNEKPMWFCSKCPCGSCSDFPGVDHEGRQACSEYKLMLSVDTRANIVSFCHFLKNVIIYDQSFNTVLNT